MKTRLNKCICSLRRHLPAIALMASIFLLPSCIRDDRDNFLPDETVYLLNSSLQTVSSSAGEYSLVLVKSGKGDTACKVRITVDEQILAAYNQENRENLLLLPDNVFSLSETEVDFSKTDFRKVVTVSWESAALQALLTLGNYAIPLSLECDGVDAVEGKESIIIQPVDK